MSYTRKKTMSILGMATVVALLGLGEAAATGFGSGYGGGAGMGMGGYGAPGGMHGGLPPICIHEGCHKTECIMRLQQQGMHDPCGTCCSMKHGHGGFDLQNCMERCAHKRMKKGI